MQLSVQPTYIKSDTLTFFYWVWIRQSSSSDQQQLEAAEKPRATIGQKYRRADVIQFLYFPRTEEKTTNLFQEPTVDFANTVRGRHSFNSKEDDILTRLQKVVYLDIEAQVESTTEADDQDGLDYQEITTDISGTNL